MTAKSAGPSKGTTFAFSMKMQSTAETSTQQSGEKDYSLKKISLNPSTIKEEDGEGIFSEIYRDERQA